MRLWEYCYRHAEYYRWLALRSSPLRFHADPIDGRPWKWIHLEVREEMGREAHKALARYWLRKARQVREGGAV